MKQIWYILNIGFLMLALWSGYRSLEPARLEHTNPDLVFCLVTFLTLPLFAVGTVYYSIFRGGHEMLPRPSWDRNPINWWGDPLQSLFISTCYMGATAIGAALRRPVVGSVAFWMMAFYCSTAIGLLVGQLLVYRIYHRHIIQI